MHDRDARSTEVFCRNREISVMTDFVQWKKKKKKKKDLWDWDVIATAKNGNMCILIKITLIYILS